MRLTEAGSVKDGRGDRQGLHREGFSQVEGQGEVWMRAGGLVLVLCACPPYQGGQAQGPRIRPGAPLVPTHEVGTVG